MKPCFKKKYLSLSSLWYTYFAKFFFLPFIEYLLDTRHCAKNFADIPLFLLPTNFEEASMIPVLQMKKLDLPNLTKVPQLKTAIRSQTQV